MKKVTAYVGSARKKNTYKAVEQFLYPSHLNALKNAAGKRFDSMAPAIRKMLA